MPSFLRESVIKEAVNLIPGVANRSQQDQIRATFSALSFTA